MSEYSITERQMSWFERKVKRNPRKYARKARKMTDQQMADYIKYGFWTPKRRRVLLWVFLIMLIIALINTFSGSAVK